MTTTENPILKVTDLVVNYGGVRAVDGVSISVRPGQLCGLIGPNGSGKSSMLAAISKLGVVSGGKFELRGQDYSGQPAHVVAAMGLARTFQTVHLEEGLTVLENVMMGADKPVLGRSVLSNWLRQGRAHSDEKRSKAKATECLARVGLTSVADEHPHALSYGTQRLVEIARSLATDPVILLLDEPAAGMSRAETDAIARLMIDLRDEGLTQLLVEHDLSMIHAVCDHVFALNFGQLIAQGDSMSVANDDAVRKAYIGDTDAIPMTGGA
jgi:ABC-type branched-subunit amino acid transport system ATPase component